MKKNLLTLAIVIFTLLLKDNSALSSPGETVRPPLTDSEGHPSCEVRDAIKEVVADFKRQYILPNGINTKPCLTNPTRKDCAYSDLGEFRRAVLRKIAVKRVDARRLKFELARTQLPGQILNTCYVRPNLSWCKDEKPDYVKEIIAEKYTLEQEWLFKYDAFSLFPEVKQISDDDLLTKTDPDSDHIEGSLYLQMGGHRLELGGHPPEANQ